MLLGFSDRLLDGTLFYQDTEQIDLQQILDELKKKGMPSESAIPEEQIRLQWYPSSEEHDQDDWNVADTSKAEQLHLF